MLSIWHVIPNAQKCYVTMDENDRDPVSKAKFPVHE
jgi:hypothetical protein